MTIEATKQSETSLSQDVWEEEVQCGGEWKAKKQTETWILTFRFFLSSVFFESQAKSTFLTFYYFLKINLH